MTGPEWHGVRSAQPARGNSRWRRECGGVQTNQAKRLQELDRENARLKKLLAEVEQGREMLRAAASG